MTILRSVYINNRVNRITVMDRITITINDRALIEAVEATCVIGFNVAVVLLALLVMACWTGE